MSNQPFSNQSRVFSLQMRENSGQTAVVLSPLETFMSSFLEPENMLGHMAKGTLQMWLRLGRVFWIIPVGQHEPLKAENFLQLETQAAEGEVGGFKE